MDGLQNLRAHDGSRQFASLPATRGWVAVRDHVHALEGAELTGFVCDGVTEAWIDFTFRGESFAVNDQFGEYWFFVSDASCGDQPLRAVRAHWASLLGA